MIKILKEESYYIICILWSFYFIINAKKKNTLIEYIYLPNIQALNLLVNKI